jgi:hypothetical protein
MMIWISRPLVAIATSLAASLLLFGCSVIHLYDAGKESPAKDVKGKYTALNLPGLLSVESQNLDALLEEELAIVREAHSLRLDLALLRIADDNEPIGAAIAREVKRGNDTRPSSFSRRLSELGFDGIAALRAVLNAADLVSSRAEAVRGRIDRMKAAGLSLDVVAYTAPQEPRSIARRARRGSGAGTSAGPARTLCVTDGSTD